MVTNSINDVDIIQPNVRLVLTHGIAGCGKSTWAQSLVDANPARFARVNRDDLRIDIYGDNYFKTKSRPQEKAIDLAQLAVLKEHLARGKTVIVDDTNIKPWVIWRIVSAAFEAGVRLNDIQQRYFDVPLETVIERNKKRYAEGGRLAPDNLIESMYTMGYNEEGILRRYEIREDGIVAQGRLYTNDKEGIPTHV